ncbi:CBS and ACT domain-containing protein [Salisaeta longa]|uniref:CBS and ACT domain-containing protein n=1 Tax=Salisaeta longa TaxID=503170 RepID=UPI002265C66C|nr:CBS and ACT domain-containing protein [Salisaeta longa]
MQHPVVTTAPGRSIVSAYRYMHEHDLRHLPVMDGRRLVGVVTDRDLRFATSALHPRPSEAEASVEQVMTPDPITAGPLDPVEEAARLLQTKRIGCLPVLDGADLRGIVTVTNVMEAVLRLTGIEKPGGRLAVALVDEPGQLARLTQRVAEAGLDIRSVLSYYRPHQHEGPEAAPEASEDRLHVILRVDTLNVRPIAEALRSEGFDVVWPVAKPS